MMNRKDFEAVAQIIRFEVVFVEDTDGHCYNCRERIRHIANELADYLAMRHPRFDVDKFLTACGVKYRRK